MSYTETLLQKAETILQNVTYFAVIVISPAYGIWALNSLPMS